MADWDIAFGSLQSRKAAGAYSFMDEIPGFKHKEGCMTLQFHIIDTHAKMALYYGVDVTVAAAELVKFDMMGSALL